MAERIADLAGKLVIGDPTKPETEVGPLIRHAEVDRVAEWIKEAADGGAEIITGGNKVSASCHACTVLYDPPGDAKVSTAEIFGPVVCVYPYDDIDDAIARANALPVAFQAAVCTRSIETALYAYRHLDASRSWSLTTPPSVSTGCRSPGCASRVMAWAAFITASTICRSRR